MVKKVIFSPEANERLAEIVSYLVNEWSTASAEKFLNILDHKIENIKLFPQSNPKLNINPGVRCCKVVKQISIYYRIHDDEIEIVTLFDNRQKKDQ